MFFVYYGFFFVLSYAYIVYPLLRDFSGLFVRVLYWAYPYPLGFCVVLFLLICFVGIVVFLGCIALFLGIYMVYTCTAILCCWVWGLYLGIYLLSIALGALIMLRFMLLSLVSVCALGVGSSAFAADDPLMANEFAPVIMSPRATFVHVPAPDSGDVEVKDLDRVVVHRGRIHRRHRVRRVARAYCAPTAPISTNIHPPPSSHVAPVSAPAPTSVASSSAPLPHIPPETFGVKSHVPVVVSSSVAPKSATSSPGTGVALSPTPIPTPPPTPLPASPAPSAAAPIAPTGFPAPPTSAASHVASPSGFPSAPTPASNTPSGFPTAPTADSDVTGGFPTPPTH